jgi:hypothetical protein
VKYGWLPKDKGGDVFMPMKRVLLLSSLLVATLLPQEAGASLAPMLPESSHYDGFVYYQDDEWDDGGFSGTVKLRGRIDFAVYDTETYENEFIGEDGFTKPGNGRYIYAYQIFNDYARHSEGAISYFAALGIDMNMVDIASISSQEDPESGVKPSPADPDISETGEYFTDTPATLEDAVWEFGTNERDWINAGLDEHSWFLVFSSDKDWVAGSYEIRGPQQGQFPIPEPATLILLGIGGAMLLKRRNKFV